METKRKPVVRETPMSEKIRVVFLDIDGVLNSFAEDRRRTVKQTRLNNREDVTFAEMWCPEEVPSKNLITLVNAFPNVQVVISSTWRHQCKSAYIWECLLYAAGGRVSPISVHFNDPCTPRTDGCRGDDIDDWLMKHYDSVESFVILDDDADMEPYMDRLVQTDGDVGLTEADVVKAIEILGTEWK